MSTDKITLIYILGMGRSGTTLLHRILGQLPDCFAAGELFLMWQRNLIQNRLCGCGARFKECHVWQSIFDEAFQGMDRVDAQNMQAALDQNLRTRHLPQLLFGNTLTSRRRNVQLIVDNLSSLYASIANVTGSRIIIDASKWPTYALVLNQLPNLNVKILHVVRDSRAVAYAWQKHKPQPDGGDVNELMGRMQPWYSSMLWNVWNASAELTATRNKLEYLRVNWENFIAAPSDTFEQIVERLNLPIVKSPFLSQTSVSLNPDHTVSGNPNRFDSGEIVIDPHEEWKANFPDLDTALVGILTAPLMLKYGYMRTKPASLTANSKSP